MKENLMKSPEKGHALRIVLDLTPEETAAEVKAREEQLAQMQANLQALRVLEERQGKLRKLVGG